MATHAKFPKTFITIEDESNRVVDKRWIVGEPNDRLNYIGHANDPKNHNECRTFSLIAPPKYFSTYAEARACAKFWNEKVPWKYDPSKRVSRHEMNCAFKPLLVKVTFA